MEFNGRSKDAVDQDDLRGRLKTSKSEIEDRERDVLKRPDETYCAKFWPYLKEDSEMMASHMVADVRKEAEMAIGDDGKPLHCYTNNSESMNNVMKSAKATFLKQNPCVSQLNKIQFMQNVFEVVHAHQMKGMHSAIAGVSDEYVLADHARYLQVPADVGFEWTPEMRKDYVLRIPKLSINDVFKQKDIPWPSFESYAPTKQWNFDR